LNLIAPEDVPTEWQQAPRFAEPEAGQVDKRFEYGAA
jgi:hypothetical protein